MKIEVTDLKLNQKTTYVSMSEAAKALNFRRSVSTISNYFIRGLHALLSPPRPAGGGSKDAGHACMQPPSAPFAARSQIKAYKGKYIFTKIDSGTKP